MSRFNECLPPGTLRAQLVSTVGRALRCGALQPVATETITLRSEGLDFTVRVLSNIAPKDRARAEQTREERHTGAPISPFLPPEEALTVGGITCTHIGVLNKFNVLDLHMLIVTRGFEHQERLLTPADFQAAWQCLGEFDGLVFYNGGRVAGASQPHKHLQLVPLPLTAGAGRLPLEPFIEDAAGATSGASARLGFAHVCATLPDRGSAGPADEALSLWRIYRVLLERAAVGIRAGPDGERQANPYNLLLTRRWMMLVPRRCECWQGVSVNALGFVGALLVRDASQLGALREAGVMAVLKGVSRAGGGTDGKSP